MAEEKYKENEKILEDQKFIEKYGLPKKESEEALIEDLKFSNSFWVVSDYLQWARSLIAEGRVKECGHFIERAKYVLRGCKEGP